MKIRKIFPIRNFPHRLFAIVAIFTIIALLLTLKPVAEVVKKGAEAVGINFPPLDLFQNVAANMLLLGLAVMGILVASIILVPIVKISVTIAGVAIAAVALWNIYKSFTGKSTQKILPEGKIDIK